MDGLSLLLRRWGVVGEQSISESEAPAADRAFARLAGSAFLADTSRLSASAGSGATSRRDAHERMRRTAYPIVRRDANTHRAPISQGGRRRGHFEINLRGTFSSYPRAGCAMPWPAASRSIVARAGLVAVGVRSGSASSTEEAVAACRTSDR